MFQILLNNSWLLIPIIIGLVNVGVRVQQKAKEQRIRRDAQNELNRRRQEALRTGRPLEEAQVVYDKPSPQDDRKARIEALRKQRMEQLQMLREKRAGVSAAQTASQPARPPVSQTRPRPPVPTRKPQPMPRPRPQSQAQPSYQHPMLPGLPQRQQAKPRPAQQPSRPRVIAPQQQPARPKSLLNAPPPASLGVKPPDRPKISASDLRQSKRAKRALTLQDQGSFSKPMVDTSGGPLQSGSDAGSDISARSMLKSPGRVRQAFALKEIIDSPVALRDPETGPGSLSI
ncbi:MAG: hypothetical protein WD114_00215 [Phycisphaerales bacterium]